MFRFQNLALEMLLRTSEDIDHRQWGTICFRRRCRRLTHWNSWNNDWPNVHEYKECRHLGWFQHRKTLFGVVRLMHLSFLMNLFHRLFASSRQSWQFSPLSETLNLGTDAITHRQWFDWEWKKGTTTKCSSFFNQDLKPHHHRRRRHHLPYRVDKWEPTWKSRTVWFFSTWRGWWVSE